jgi:UDP-N-acetylenolpyruvoylglucosamine reductase
VKVQTNAPIPTWFRIGGRADRFTKPRTHEELLACVRMDPSLRVLGDGANLLVHDDGVGELVISLESPRVGEDRDRREDRASGRGRGRASLPRLIKATIDAGLSGL